MVRVSEKVILTKVKGYACCLLKEAADEDAETVCLFHAC